MAKKQVKMKRESPRKLVRNINPYPQTHVWELAEDAMWETMTSRKQNFPWDQGDSYWLYRADLAKAIDHHVKHYEGYPKVVFHYGANIRPGKHYQSPVVVAIPETQGQMAIGCMQFSVKDTLKILRWADAKNKTKKKAA